ncbi:hypothetical protein [Naasia sp. SYSU D00057]|uniref:hypothetical protein n=1 Tax=Naasia sp. SYSU D00057 TaxID=2817380 RepID=UPI001B310485|nr:hypothetical protein [Naasia sp. SYSU D00057]
MDQSNVINLGLFLLTAVGVLVSCWQALDARRARNDARVASADAERHEQAALDAARRSALAAEESASASTRSADASERIAAAVEMTATPPRPWLLEYEGGERWKAINNTGVNVDFVAVTGKPQAWVVPDTEVPRDVAAGESISFRLPKRLNSPSSVTVKVVWRNPDMTGDEYFETVRPQ